MFLTLWEPLFISVVTKLVCLLYKTQVEGTIKIVILMQFLFQLQVSFSSSLSPTWQKNFWWQPWVWWEKKMSQELRLDFCPLFLLWSSRNVNQSVWVFSCLQETFIKLIVCYRSVGVKSCTSANGYNQQIFQLMALLRISFKLISVFAKLLTLMRSHQF